MMYVTAHEARVLLCQCYCDANPLAEHRHLQPTWVAQPQLHALVAHLLMQRLQQVRACSTHNSMQTERCLGAVMVRQC